MRVNSNWTAIVAIAVCLAGSTCLAANLVGRTTAARYGLKSAWYTQVAGSTSTGKVSHATVDAGSVLVQTERNRVTALAPETGRVLWTAQIGPANRVSTEPGANEKFVAIVNGSVLYVLDHTTGDVLWTKELPGCPGAGPAVTQTHVFVPMLDGQITGYELEAGAKQTPWIYKSAGRTAIPPVTTPRSVSWTTERGYMYVADPTALGIRYRVETRDMIQSPPAYWTPYLYAGSTDGILYAVNELNGRIEWKFSVGDAFYASPVAIENRVYATSQLNGMYCLDAKTGKQVWFAPAITQFVSASPSRVYATDKVGRLTVLDAESGTRLAVMPLNAGGTQLINNRSDRIYLVSDAGVVQCLRELALVEPVTYRAPDPEPPKREAKPREDREPPEQPADEPPAEPADDASPFGEAAPPMNEDEPESPFEVDAENPFQ